MQPFVADERITVSIRNSSRRKEEWRAEEEEDGIDKPEGLQTAFKVQLLCSPAGVVLFIRPCLIGC